MSARYDVIFPREIFLVACGSQLKWVLIRGEPLHSYEKSGYLIDVARFVLLSLVAVPFAGWVSTYCYSYYMRINNCVDAIKQGSDSLAHSSTHFLKPVFFFFLWEKTLSWLSFLKGSRLTGKWHLTE
jgi:hypothetical protein